MFLPPRESVDVTLRYVPGKGDLEALPVRFAAMQVSAPAAFRVGLGSSINQVVRGFSDLPVR